MSSKRTVLIGMAIIVSGCLFAVHGGEGDPVSSRAYKGHANDLDMANLVSVYPGIAGTRLDDCQSCHTSGAVTSGGRERHKNACDFCHYIPFPDAEATGQPATFEQTLNAYGLAYNNAGRDVAALLALGAEDSDGDGAPNDEELADGKYPGDAGSQPGQKVAPMTILDMADLRALPVHQQFLLANSHKQQFDAYDTYTGVRVIDLLNAVGVDLDQIDGITIIAPDGYMKDFSLEAIRSEYPSGEFYWGLDLDGLGIDCGFVTYPATVPEGLSHGEAIPDALWLMLAYERDGESMEVSYLDPTSGKIDGEGPLRIVVPQTVLEGAGVRIQRTIATRDLDTVDPFLLFDHFGSDDPDDYLAGFPMHPHRGIETVTYMLAGAVNHRDTIGNSGTIGAGDVQWMTSGGGIMHEEMPEPRDGRLAGFQLWVNLPARLKMSRPRYQEIPSAAVPELTLAGGAQVRVIAGAVDGARGPVTDIAANPTYLDVSLAAGGTFNLPVPRGHAAFAYVFEGQGRFGLDQDGREAVAGSPRLVLFDDGDRVEACATDQTVRFLLISGKPLNEPIARYGPFVMNTRAEIEQALRDLRAGTFVWRE